MLCASRSYSSLNTTAIDWHVGKLLPSREFFAIDTINYVQADGDELDWIFDNISGIPFNKSNVQCWFGDDAKFIFSSLPRTY